MQTRNLKARSLRRFALKLIARAGFMHGGLAFTVDSLDGVPEAQRALYKESNGKFVLDVEGYEDPVGLKSALQKERERANSLDKQAKAWAAMGKTPEEIQELLEAQRRAEEEKALKGGEFEKLKQQIIEQHKAELAKKDERLGAMTKTLERHLVDAAATAAIAAAKGVPGLLLPHVRSSVKVVEDNGEFKVQVVDASGSPRVNGQGNPLSIADLVGEMRQSDVYGRAFEPNGTSGGGAGQGGNGGGSGGGKRTITRAQFEALPIEQRQAALKDATLVD